MKPKGIFDPFGPPQVPQEKPPERSVGNFDMTAAEEVGQTEPETNVRLDGGSYILELRDLEVDKVPERLGQLVKDVIEKHPEHMLQQGIQLLPRGSTFDTEEQDLILPTPVGYLVVYVGELDDDEQPEDAAYRRIAYSLLHLPINDILDQHQARVIVRS